MGLVRNATHSAIEWAGSKNGMLFRIEFLVTICAVILTALVFLGSLRRRSDNPVLKFALWGSCTASYIVVSYTTGLMQSAPFKNELFVVWATFLLLLLGSADSITAYSLEDNEQQTRTIVHQLIQIGFVIFLQRYYSSDLGNRFKWLLFVLQMISVGKMLMMINSYRLASRSKGLIKTNKLVSDYMTYEHEDSSQHEMDPCSMSGYKYLVTGEENQNLEPAAPEYVQRLQMNDDIITIDKVWQCKGGVLSCSSDRDSKRKDILLSYALFKLLRRRFGGYPLAESRLQKTRDFVLQGLHAENGDIDRAFRVIEVELAFLYDFFYTKYPSLFSPDESPFSDAILFVIFLVASIWTSSSTLTHYHTPVGEQNLIFHEVNVDIYLTNSLVILVIIMEFFQAFALVVSDWSKVRLLCNYLRRPSWKNNVYIKRGLKHLCNIRLIDTWEKKINKYLLLRDYNYHPILSQMTFGLLDKAREGQKINSAIKLPRHVKKAVSEALRRSNGILTNGRSSLQQSEVEERLSWACQLEMHSQTILVWHIATTLCENDPHHDVGMLSTQLQMELEGHMKVATDLSGYCAYLVAFVPSLLPDHSYNTELIFDSVIREARRHLEGCETMRTKFDRMMSLEEPVDCIMKMGAKLGRQLIEEIPDLRLRWRVLADFWAEMVLFLAPSDDAIAHAEKLTTGGEFITHLWALLTHAGIVERPSAREY